MARRSRSRGGAPPKEQAHKHRDPNMVRKPPSHSPEATLDALFDALDTAFLNGDEERAAELMADGLAITHGNAPKIIVRRLIEDRAKVPGVTLTLLREISRDNAPKHLRKIANASSAPDFTRIEARRMLGWIEGEDRIAFLDSLSDGDSALALMAAGISHSWPTQPFIVPEVVGYLLAVPPARRRTLIERIVSEAGPASIPVLHAMLHVDDPETQINAIEALEGFRFAGSVGPLTRLARTASNPDFRTRAAAALRDGDFSLLEVPQSDDDRPPFPDEDVGVPTRAVMSSVSFTGEQATYVLRQMTDEIVIGVGFTLDDSAGILEAFPLLPGTPEDVQQRMFDTSEPTSELVDISPAAARGAFTLALDLMAERDIELSPEIEVWEPFLHESYPPSEDEEMILPSLDDSGYAGRHDLVERGAELYLETDFFIAWGFDEEPTELLMDRVELPHVDDWTDEHYRTVLDALATPEIVTQLPERLRRQAYLLDASGWPDMKDIALAVAASLNGATLDDLASNPFMRHMAMISIDWSRSPFFGMNDDEISAEMANLDPRAMFDALDALGIAPEELLQIVEQRREDAPQARSVEDLLKRRP